MVIVQFFKHTDISKFLCVVLDYLMERADRIQSVQLHGYGFKVSTRMQGVNLQGYGHGSAGGELRAVKLEGGCCRVYELKGHYFQIRFNRMSTLGRHSHTLLAIPLISKIEKRKGGR